MFRAQVSSSSVVSVGYDEAAQVLEVEFTGGRVYQYFDVPSSVHAEMMSGVSVGKYIAAQVKPYYRYARL